MTHSNRGPAAGDALGVSILPTLAAYLHILIGGYGTSPSAPTSACIIDHTMGLQLSDKGLAVRVNDRQQARQVALPLDPGPRAPGPRAPQMDLPAYVDWRQSPKLEWRT